jgi:DNA segregation ATPase FtsK/SpoIIIE-like protein
LIKIDDSLHGPIIDHADAKVHRLRLDQTPDLTPGQVVSDLTDISHSPRQLLLSKLTDKWCPFPPTKPAVTPELLEQARTEADRLPRGIRLSTVQRRLRVPYAVAVALAERLEEEGRLDPWWRA